MSFDFNLRLVTGDSAVQIGAVAKGLDDTTKHGKHAADSVKLFEGEVGKLSGTVGGLTLNLQALSGGGHLFVFDLAEGFKAAYEIAAKLVEKVIEIGKEVIGAVAKTEDLDLGLRANLGANFEAVDEMAEKFGKVSRYRAEQIKGLILPLTEIGIKDEKALGNITAAALDIAARRNTGIGGASDVISSLTRIQLSGKVQARALIPLGIEAGAFWEDFAKGTGKSVAQLQALQGKTKGFGAELVKVALHQIAVRQGSEALGKTALASALTLGGAMDRLKSLPDDIFRKLAGSVGIEKVHGALDGLIAAVEEQAPAAVRIFDNVFKGIFGDLAGKDGAEKLKIAIGGIVGKVEEMSIAFANAWPTIIAEAEKAWRVISKISDAVGSLAKILTYLPGALAERGIINVLGKEEQKPAGALGPRPSAAALAFLASDQATAPPPGNGIPAMQVHAPVSIVVHGHTEEAGDEVARKYEQHMRETHVRIQQQLSGR